MQREIWRFLEKGNVKRYMFFLDFDRQRKNYLMIYGSFGFFVACVLYVIFKRFLYNKFLSFFF